MLPAITVSCPNPQNKACFSLGCINQRTISKALNIASAENAAAIAEILIIRLGSTLIDIRRWVTPFQSDCLHCMLNMPKIGAYLPFFSLMRRWDLAFHRKTAAHPIIPRNARTRLRSKDRQNAIINAAVARGV